MSWLTVAKILGPLVLLAVTGWAVADRVHLKKLVDRYEQCTKAADSDSALVSACDGPVMLRIVAARRAADCEAALKADDLYAIRASCGEQVKRVQAERDARAADLADARNQLSQARSDRDQAIARAEARAATLADRTAQNERTIDAAPRGANGLLRCDAQCLRNLAEGTAAGR